MRSTGDSSHPRGLIEMSIIPDAHSIRELDRLHCRVEMARKGGVSANCTLMRCRCRISSSTSNAGAVLGEGRPMERRR